MTIELDEETLAGEGIEQFLLPKAIIQRVIATKCEGFLINKESKETFANAATLFISFLTSASLECNGTKKTLTPEAVLAGLKLCGFNDICDELQPKLVGNGIIFIVELQNVKSSKKLKQISEHTNSTETVQSHQESFNLDSEQMNSNNEIGSITFSNEFE